MRTPGAPRGTPGATVEGDLPPDDAPTTPAVEVPADSYAGKLLAARRQARKKLDGD